MASEFSIFKWLKNREDGSDFEDFWTESIASAQIFFSPNFRADENFRGDEKIFAATKKFRNARTIERTRCQKVPGKRRSRIVIDGYKIDAVILDLRAGVLSENDLEDVTTIHNTCIVSP